MKPSERTYENLVARGLRDFVFSCRQVTIVKEQERLARFNEADHLDAFLYLAGHYNIINN